MKSLKQQCAVWWLSLGKAVDAIKNNWPALVMELNEEAAGGSPQGHGLRNQIQSFGFIALTYALSDVLPVINKLNLCFQREDVNLANIRPMVQATLAALTQLKDNPGPEEQIFLRGFVGGVFRGVEVAQATEKCVCAFTSNNKQYIEHLMDILNCFDTIFNPARYPGTDYGGSILNIFFSVLKICKMNSVHITCFVKLPVTEINSTKKILCSLDN